MSYRRRQLSRLARESARGRPGNSLMAARKGGVKEMMQPCLIYMSSLWFRCDACPVDRKERRCLRHEGSRSTTQRQCLKHESSRNARKMALSSPRRQRKPQRRGSVLDAKAAETKGKRRCLRHECSGNHNATAVVWERGTRRDGDERRQSCFLGGSVRHHMDPGGVSALLLKNVYSTRLEDGGFERGGAPASRSQV